MKHILYFILLLFCSCSVKSVEQQTTRMFDEKQINYDFTVCRYDNNKLSIKNFYKDLLCIYSCLYDERDTVNPYKVKRYLYRNRELDSILLIKDREQNEKYNHIQYDYTFRYEQEINFFINELEKYNLKIPFQFRDVLGVELSQMSVFIGYYDFKEKRIIQKSDTIVGQVRKIKLDYIDTADISFQAEKLQLGSTFQRENNLLLQYSVDIVNNLPVSDKMIFSTWNMQRKYRYSQDKKGNYSVFIDYD